MLIASIFNLTVAIGVLGCLAKHLKAIRTFETRKKEFLFARNRFSMSEKGDINETKKFSHRKRYSCESKRIIFQFLAWFSKLKRANWETVMYSLWRLLNLSLSTFQICINIFLSNIVKYQFYSKGCFF